jgi:hypothetical protein
VQHNLEQNRQISRREFSRESVLAMLAGVVITISGCGDDDAGPTSPSGGDVNGSISANHGHVATVRNADITAAGAVTLDIRGTADHPHTVSLTAAQVQQIGSGQRVAVTSTTEMAHQHTITFN